MEDPARDTREELSNPLRGAQARWLEGPQIKTALGVATDSQATLQDRLEAFEERWETPR
jgi:hypothetical protein